MFYRLWFYFCFLFFLILFLHCRASPHRFVLAEFAAYLCTFKRSFLSRMPSVAAPYNCGRFIFQFELEYPEILWGNISKLHTACSCLPHTAALWCNIWKKAKKSGDVILVSKMTSLMLLLRGHFWISTVTLNVSLPVLNCPYPIPEAILLENEATFCVLIWEYWCIFTLRCCLVPLWNVKSFNCPPSHQWNEAPLLLLLLLSCWKKTISLQ